MISFCKARSVPALIVIALFLVCLAPALALAAPTVTLFAGPVTGPAGGVWLAGPPGTLGHLWVSDALRGFCRVDAGVLTNCDITAKAAGQPSYDPATSNVYVPDSSARGAGVLRLHHNQATETIDAATVLRPTDGLGASRPQASAVDSLTGSLYVGFKGSPNIVRIANPSLGVGDPAVTVAASPDGRLTLSLAVLNVLGVPDLLQASSRGVAVVHNPADCAGICPATAVATTAIGLTAPLSLVSDNKATVYAGDATSVWRLDLAAPLSATNPGVYASGFNSVSGLALDSLGTVYAGDDPSGGLVPLSGHIWAIASAASPAPAPAPFTVPGAPTIGTASGGNAQASVTWTAPASDGGSPITSYTVTAAPGGLSTTVAAPATSATVTGLTNGTAYTLTVTAANVAGSGPASAASNSVAPIAPLSVPGAPTAVTATAGDTLATLTWTPPTSDGGSPITSYTVTASPGGLPTSVVAPATSATVSGLTNSLTYTFTVTATNVIGTSLASAASNPVTPGPATLPVSPTGPVVVLTQNPPNPSGSSTVTFIFSASTSPATFQCSLAAASAPPAFAPCASPQTYTGVTDGTHTFSVTATDANGLTGAPVSYTFAVQTLTTATVEAPAASLLTPARASLAGVDTTISWSASACTTGVAGCNIASYQLQESVNGGPFVDVPLSSPTATSVARTLRPNLLSLPIAKTHVYQVRATNGQGQVSAFAVGPKVTLGLLDDAIGTSFAGPWSGNVVLGALLGQVHWSSTAGAFAGPSSAFVGSGAGFVSTLGHDRGKALITVDGAPAAVIDLYAPTQQAAQVVWSTSGLSPATSHTVKVIVLGIHNAASSGARVDYDGMLILK